MIGSKNSDQKHLALNSVYIPSSTRETNNLKISEDGQLFNLGKESIMTIHVGLAIDKSSQFKPDHCVMIFDLNNLNL